MNYRALSLLLIVTLPTYALDAIPICYLKAINLRVLDLNMTRVQKLAGTLPYRHHYDWYTAEDICFKSPNYYKDMVFGIQRDIAYDTPFKISRQTRRIASCMIRSTDVGLKYISRDRLEKCVGIYKPKEMIVPPIEMLFSSASPMFNSYRDILLRKDIVLIWQNNQKQEWRKAQPEDKVYVWINGYVTDEAWELDQFKGIWVNGVIKKINKKKYYVEYKQNNKMFSKWFSPRDIKSVQDIVSTYENYDLNELKKIQQYRINIVEGLDSMRLLLLKARKFYQQVKPYPNWLIEQVYHFNWDYFPNKIIKTVKVFNNIKRDKNVRGSFHIEFQEKAVGGQLILQLSPTTKNLVRRQTWRCSIIKASHPEYLPEPCLKTGLPIHEAIDVFGSE